MIRVLGIDPGTATTGWAILEENKECISPLAYGHISTSSQKKSAERLWEICQDLKKIIERYSPDEAAVEDIFFFKNVKTAVKVSESRGAVLLTLQENKVRIFSYTPLQVKQAVTGYGRAGKKQIQEMVKSILRLKSIPKPDDAADAVAIALCHLSSRKFKILNE